MTPQQFITQIKGPGPAPVYLFAGPEMHRRRGCRRFLIEKFLPADMREEGLTRHDMEDLSVTEVIDDASSLSLFATKRVILVTSAEAGLPKGALSDKEELPAQAALKAYVKNPTPGVVLVFDSSRITYDSEDKTKMERLRKFYAAIPNVVEFPAYTEDEARKLAADEAKRAGLAIGGPQLEALVESLGYDAVRIVTEIEKLALFTGGNREVTDDDIASMTPDARATSVFALAAALGRGDRALSLDLLNTLVRDGEYLPLVLTFLSSQFRYALAAKEEGLRSPQQIQGHFTKLGIPMWSSRAQQVQQTVSAFNKPRIEAAIKAIYEADKGMRDRSPDDRIVMERLVLAITQ